MNAGIWILTHPFTGALFDYGLACWNALLHSWYIWALAPVILPYILAPILPRTFKTKAVMELDCSVKKAYDTITTDPRYCPVGYPVGGALTEAVKVEKLDKNNKPTEWTEEIKRGKGEVITVKRDLGVKPGKTARISQTMESTVSNMTSKWEYVVEPAEGSGRSRITLSSHIDIPKGKWNGPIFRMTVFLKEGGKRALIEHLNLVADASGSKRKWIA